MTENQVTENQVTENQVTEKPLIESQPVNVNQLQKLLLENHPQSEHLEHLIQNQTPQNEKRVFKTIY